MIPVDRCPECHSPYKFRFDPDDDPQEYAITVCHECGQLAHRRDGVWVVPEGEDRARLMQDDTVMREMVRGVVLADAHRTDIVHLASVVTAVAPDMDPETLAVLVHRVCVLEGYHRHIMDPEPGLSR